MRRWSFWLKEMAPLFAKSINKALCIKYRLTLFCQIRDTKSYLQVPLMPKYGRERTDREEINMFWHPLVFKILGYETRSDARRILRSLSFLLCSSLKDLGIETVYQVVIIIRLSTMISKSIIIDFVWQIPNAAITALWSQTSIWTIPCCDRRHQSRIGETLIILERVKKFTYLQHNQRFSHYDVLYVWHVAGNVEQMPVFFHLTFTAGVVSCDVCEK